MEIDTATKATGAWYEVLISLFIDVSERPSLMLDIGVGPKSEYLRLADIYPDMQLIGLEPNPETFEQVKPKFPGLILQKAITAGGKPMEYVVHDKNTMASGLMPYDTTPDNAERFVVEGTTLDQLDEESGGHDNILLWMDIEGYELEALKTGPALLGSGRVKWANLEVRERWNMKKAACRESEIDEFLGHYGFKKCLTYNHYPASHHHDAIYVHESAKVPASGAALTATWTEIFGMRTSDAMDEDLAHCAFDLFLATAEQKTKVAYLRGQLEKQAREIDELGEQLQGSTRRPG